ncbi:MAG: Hsp20/alpha crystallin family protein [Casimicrobiaceae bacterium]
MNPRNRAEWMWAQAFEMLGEAERLHRHFFQLAAHPAPSGPSWEPPVDVLETAERLVVLVALPGVAPEHVQVVASEGSLSVVGERLMPSSGGAALRRLEIPYGRFERRLDLPGGHYEIERRELEHGCLRLTLRKL